MAQRRTCSRHQSLAGTSCTAQEKLHFCLHHLSSPTVQKAFPLQIRPFTGSHCCTYPLHRSNHTTFPPYETLDQTNTCSVALLWSCTNLRLLIIAHEAANADPMLARTGYLNNELHACMCDEIGAACPGKAQNTQMALPLCTPVLHALHLCDTGLVERPSTPVCTFPRALQICLA